MTEPVKIIVRPNGPYFIEGSITVVDLEGKEYRDPSGKPRLALCRCGGSSAKPFCDGTHNRIGSHADEVATRDEDQRGGS